MQFREVLTQLASKDGQRIVKVGKSPVWDYKIQNDELRLIHGHRTEWPGEKPVLFEEIEKYVNGSESIRVVDEDTDEELTSVQESGNYIIFHKS